MDSGIDDGRQQRLDGVSLLLFTIAEPGSLVGLQVDQFIDRHAAGAGKAFGGLGGLAILEGCCQRRAPLLDLTIRLSVGKRFDTDGEAARRGERIRIAMRDFGFVETLDDAVAQSRGEFGECARRQLFDAQFDQ